MADVDTTYQEDDVLGDIGGVIGDALEVPRHEHEVDSSRDDRRILLHDLQQLGIDFIPQGVHFIISGEHLGGQFGVTLHEGIQTSVQHVLD